MCAEMSPDRAREFRRFQAHYLTAFLVVMLADWLQGTNMYTLYSVIVRLIWGPRPSSADASLSVLLHRH
jgi:hypothetical protein